jgi:UDP-N-acetylglucosamine/UDP-N-acetylgalactosamine diphosphorylase
MKTHGVDVISYVHVDNPLARSCDPVFVGYHLQRDCQYSCKTLAKTGPNEKVGNYALVQGRLGIIEYNDIPDDMVSARDEKQELLFGWGSPGFFLFSRSFAEKQAARTDLPVHKANKKMRHLGADGNFVDPEAPNAIKLETYAHDTLLDAKHTLVLECERASEFAPVKNARGVDSAQSARELMTALYRGWLEEAGATIVGNPQLEISPMRALDAEDLLAGGLHIDSDTYLE